jgi:hypothetical protein
MPLVDFVQLIRAQTLYPTFRTTANIGHTLTLIIAAVGALACLAPWVAFDGLRGRFIGLAGALLLALLSKVAKESAHMVADMADATVRTAARAPSAE